MITGDGKGIVMRPERLRPATAKAAARGERELATRLSPGEKNGRMRMAELACVYDCVPVPRTWRDVIRMPGTDAPAAGADRPSATGKWLTTSVTDDIPAVIGAAFDEAGRRDPEHKRTWIALLDGNTQIEAIKAGAARCGVTVTITCDVVHVLEYLGRPPGRSSSLATRTLGNGSPPGPLRSSRARPARSRRASAAALPPTGTPARNTKAPMPVPVTSDRCRSHPQASRPPRQRRLRRILGLPPQQKHERIHKKRYSPAA